MFDGVSISIAINAKCAPTAALIRKL